MIFYLFIAGLVLAGLIIMILDRFVEIEYAAYVFGVYATVLGGIVLIVLSLELLMAHVDVEGQLAQQDAAYARLQSEVAMLEDDDFNEVTFVDDRVVVLRDQIVAAAERWNEKTISDQHYAASAWLNWFYDQDVVAARQLIEIP